MNRPTTWRDAALIALRRNSFYRLYILGLLLLYCALFYYFGELVDFAGWQSLRLSFFYGIHDVQRLMFLAPIIYAGYYFGARAALIITIVSAAIFMPRALFISPFPDPVLRPAVFTIIAGTIGYLTAVTRTESLRRTRLERVVRTERDRFTNILERMADGVLITGPDYQVRYLNASMIRDFGENRESTCYRYLRQADEACQCCRLTDVLGGATTTWEYTFPNGRTYEVMASPYTDADGTACQLAIFRNITGRSRS